MKIKNSYILLIVIAIFLLISIGSVCASENITDDSDAQLADDGTDVVLSDTDGNVPDETAQEPTNTTVETDKDKYEFKKDSNKTFSVHVKDNKSSNIDVNKSDLSIMNGNKSVTFEYTNSIVTLTETLPVGNYNLTVNYLGNENYINSTKVIAVKIYGNSTIETVTSVVCDGLNIEIPVNVYDQVENITLIKDNFNLTLVYTNETGNISNLTIRNFTIEDGKIKFATPVELINASLIINYANVTEPKSVGIKVSTEVKVVTDKDKFRSEEIKNISITILDGQGNQINVTKNDLKVFDNGANITFEYNNSVITLDLGEGVHNLTFAYIGSETYNASSSEIVIKVSGNNTINVPEYVVCNESTVEIPVTIFDGSENITASHDDFTLTLTYNNETGGIASKNITEYQIENGKIIFTIENANTVNANVIIDYVNSTGAKTVKINLPSKIEATPDVNKYRVNETNNITVKVSDSLGNKLNITKNDLKVFADGKEVQFTFDNTTSILNAKLTEGVHNVTITYVGDNTYNSSSTTIEQKVYGDIKFNPDTVAVLDENNKVTITINLNDGADLVNITQSKLNITVFYTIGNVTKNATVAYELNDQNVTFDLNDDFDSAYANIKYAENNLTATTKIKANTVITVDSEIVVGETEDKTIKILVNGTNGHVINITKDNLKIFKDGKALNIEINGSIVTIKDAFKFGAYNLTVKYLGDDTYIESVKNITLKVYGINATTPININSSKKGEVKLNVISGNETLNINSTDLVLNVTYKNGNDTVVIKVNDIRYENGTLYFTLENASFTTATLNIKYNHSNVNVTLNRIFNAKIEIIKGTNEYKTGSYTFRLVDVDDGSNITGKTFRLTTTGNLRAGFTATTNSEGIASFRTAQLYTFDQTGNASLNMKEFEVGAYQVDLETEGNVKATKVTTNLTVTKANIQITIDPYKETYGSKKNVTMSVKNSAGEPMAGIILKLTIDGIKGTYYLYTDSNGTSQIAIYSQSSKSGLVGGDYVFHVSNNDTKNINSKSAKKTITVVKIKTKINAKDVTVYYNTGTTSTIKITDKKTGKAVSGMYVLVRLYSTSKKYNDYLFQTNKKGKIAFSASLTVGKHKMVISSADNRYSASKVTKTITVKKAKAKITAKKVKTYYKSGKPLTIKVINTKNKKPIYNAAIKVGGQKYRTGMDGKLNLAVDTLKPGTYKVTVKGADKGFTSNKVTTKIVIKKTKAKITPKKLTAKKGAKKYFKVTVKNKKTKKAVQKAKVKIKVYTGKKAKTYKVKTNAKGVAKISTKNLKVGNHKVVVTSAEKYVSAKKAKSTIKIKK